MTWTESNVYNSYEIWRYFQRSVKFLYFYVYKWIFEIVSGNPVSSVVIID